MELELDTSSPVLLPITLTLYRFTWNIIVLFLLYYRRSFASILFEMVKGEAVVQFS